MTLYLRWLTILLSLQLKRFETADSVVKFEVFEEEKPGTIVGNISTTDIVSKIDAFEGTFQFQFQGITPPTAFDIDKATGVIRTATELDRETLSLLQDTFQIQVKVSKGLVTAVIPTEIRVLDINDNSPTFKESVENISVSESAPLGAELSLTAAEDDDIGNNSVQSYDIVSRNDDGNFQLKVVRPTSDITKVKLIVSKSLDRELNDSFYLVIEAKDGGNPPKSCRKGVNITIIDSNDHIPKFDKDLYVGEVKENSPAGTVVLNVTATDKDIGTNGEITYSLKLRPEYEGLFSLNSTTGELQTNAVLDYEKSKVYQLEITARDLGPDSIPSTAVIKVKVLDENDNTPEISLKFLPDARDKEGKVPEDTPVETGLAIVTVRDKDSANNGRVTVTLFQHRNDFGLREVFAGQYILEVRRPLSLDRYRRYKIGILAKDAGTPASRQDSQMVTIHLSDSNRHAPVFEKEYYQVQVRDDITPAAVISTPIATDKDDGKNARLHYSLVRLRVGARDVSSEHIDGWFVIDPQTGHVRVVTRLFCVFTPSFLLKVDCRDSGRVPLHGSAELNISVQCSQHVYNFSIAENKPAGSEVGTIQLSPTALQKTLEMKLNVSEESADFFVDEMLGVIITTTMLDREETESYSLAAVISDGTVDMRITLNIIVLDVNDNAPVFVDLRDDDVVLTTAVSPGDKLFTVRAVDRDSGLNGEIKYYIIDGDKDQLFSIEQHTGEVTLRKDLNDLSYLLLIKAADSGLIQNEAVLRVKITVKFELAVPSGSGVPQPATSGSNIAVVDNRKAGAGFFADKDMIIVVGACAGFALLFVFVLAVFCVKCRRRGDVDKRGSYHEPEISREDALKASKKMYNQATINYHPSTEVLTFARNKPINVSPLPIKKVHPSMAGKGAIAMSPPGNPLPVDVYYPDGQAVVECHSSEDELDSGRGGSFRGSSPYCAHSPSSKKKEVDCRSLQEVRYPTPPQRYRSPMMPPPPPSYDDVQRRRAFVTISGVTHSTTDL